MAGTTGLEPATSAVTGQRSNQLNYVPRNALVWWAVRDLNTRPSGCKPDALTAELTALVCPGAKTLSIVRDPPLPCKRRTRLARTGSGVVWLTLAASEERTANGSSLMHAQNIYAEPMF